MRRLNLRSQLAVVAGLFLVYSLGVGASFWLQTRAHARLEAQFHKSLTVLSNLPRLRDQLRRIDQSSGQYLLSGQRQWLDRRNDALREVRVLTVDLSKAMSEPHEKTLLDAMDQRLTSYLAESSQWITQRRGGRINVRETARLGRNVESVVEPLSRLGDAQVAQLRARRMELEDVSRVNVVLIVVAGAIAAAFVALFLSFFLTGPVSALRIYARDWTFGQEWNFSPRRIASHEIVDLSETMREMANRLNAQYEREAELGKLKGSLVSMASHEFNNALSILGGTENLLRMTEPVPPTGKRAEYYLVIESNLRSLALAVSNLLDLGRLEGGKFTIHPRRTDLARIITDVSNALKPLYERKHLNFELQIPPDFPPALGDPEGILLVITNLVGNAVKYTPESGRVVAALTTDADGRLRMSVTDSGIGIALEDQELIRHGHRTNEGKKAASGFGVGLTIVTRVLSAHATTLDIESSQGKGSTFSFSLPRWKAPEDVSVVN